MRRFTLCLATVSFLSVPSLLWGQATDPNFETALKPFGSYNGGNIDRVNVMNGQLTLDIPLASFPQRGNKLSLGFTLSYHNHGAWSDWSQGSNPDVPVGYVTGSFGFDQGFTVMENSGAATTPVTMRNIDTIDQNQTMSTVVVRTTSADGADHYMVKNTAGDFTQSSTWYSGDLSGYRAHFDSEILYSDNYWGASNATLYGPDGTSYSGSAGGIGVIGGTFGLSAGPDIPTLRQDSNGNQISYSTSNGYTDTLGRTIPQFISVQPSESGCPSGTSSASRWLPPGPNGQTYPLTFCFKYWSSATAAQTFNENGNLVAASGGAGGLKQIILPNGTSWKFEYSSEGPNPDTYNDLTKVTLPTGGTISYTWGSHLMCLTHMYMLPRTLLTRTVNPNTPGQMASTTSYSYSGSLCGAYTATITDGAGNDSIHYFDAGQVISGGGPYELSTEYYNGSGSGSRSLMRTVQNSYYSQSAISGLAPSATTIQFLSSATTTDAASGQQSLVSYSYDNNLIAYPSTMYTYYAYPNPPVYNPSSLSFGKQIGVTQYDFGQGSPGSVLRQTSTSYSAFSDPNHAADYLAANMLDLPYQTTISGTVGETAKTTYSYDEGSVQSSGISTSHVSPGTGVRGNLTTISRANDGSTIASTSTCPATSVSNTTTYYDTGTPYQSFDPCGNKTEYAYNTSYAGAYPTSATRYAGSSGTNQSSSTTYDLNLGQPVDVTDTNGITTHNVLDCMGRTVETDYNYSGTSSTGKVQYLYNDGVGGNGCSSTVGVANSVTIKQQLDDKRWIQNEIDVDGLGRQSQTLLSHGGGTIYTSIYYDSMGRIGSKTNPSRCSSLAGCTETTAGQTTYQYDALGRLHIQSLPGSGSLQYDYAGNAVTFTDAASRSWKRVSDSLGRLTDVYEDPTGLNLHTSYQYDGMNNLTQVSGVGGYTRTFKYDALSRLTKASNPETGTSCYGTWNSGSCGLDGYDALGNLVKKADANGKVITYSYDRFNNLLGKQYSDTTPSDCYQYGTVAPYVGRLTGQWTQTGACASTLPSSPLTSRTIQGYNFRGQPTSEQQCVLGICTPNSADGLSYQYDLAGNLLQYAAPGATTNHYVYNTYDLAGWKTTVGYTTSTSAGSPVQPLSFVLGVSPVGGVTGAMAGSHLGLIKAYDQQFRPTGLEVNPQ